MMTNESFVVPTPTSVKIKEKSWTIIKVLYLSIVILLLYLPVIFMIIFEFFRIMESRTC